MAEDTGGEKSLPASPQKILKAREEGNIAKSQDLGAGFALALALLALFFLAKHILSTLIMAGRYFLGNAHELTTDNVSQQFIAIQVLYHLAVSVLPFMLIMVVGGVTLNLLQVGVLFTAAPLKPKFSKLNPITGAKKFVSARTFVEFAKSMSKLILIGTIAWFALRNRREDIISLMEMTPLTILPVVTEMIVAVWWRVAVAMIILGIIDFGFQKWQHLRDLRMTHQEVKQESREMEGDPQIKRKVRQLQRQMAMQRMMADVPKADVIITNPTHYAVALRYDMREMTSPVVIAKGARLQAQRIREIGLENNVPIVQNPELARALFDAIEVGHAIPEHLYRAVAEVLSYVYQIDRREEKRKERTGFVTAGAA